MNEINVFLIFIMRFYKNPVDTHLVQEYAMI